MLTVTLITGAVVLLFQFIRTLNKGNIKNKKLHLTELAAQDNKTVLPVFNGEIVVRHAATADKMFTDIWWNKLTAIQQLQLALALCQKAMPIWQQYSDGKEISYRSYATGPLSKINHNILHTTLEVISGASRSQFPAANNKKINDCHSSFVDAVLALQDGVWLPAYPVKKIFLAVYSILKSIVEQSNNSGTAIILSAAINQALDCIDITKLHSREKIDSFLNLYKNKLLSSSAVCI